MTSTQERQRRSSPPSPLFLWLYNCSPVSSQDVAFLTHPLVQPHKCPLRINHFLSTTRPLAELFSALRYKELWYWSSLEPTKEHQTVLKACSQSDTTYSRSCLPISKQQMLIRVLEGEVKGSKQAASEVSASVLLAAGLWHPRDGGTGAQLHTAK